MKKIAMIFSFFTMLAVSGIASANFVGVSTTYMSGTMEGGGPQSFYVRAYGYANNTVYFGARNSVGATFTCYVTTANPIYRAAADIRNNMTDGTYIYATATATNQPCRAVYHLKDSRYMYH